MIINLVSDLHLGIGMPTSRGDYPRKINLEPADVLVIAGDVLEDLAEWDTCFIEQFECFGEVIYVPGNHDFWSDEDIREVHNRQMDYCHSIGVTMLQNSSVTIDGVKFAGSTMWTDFNKDDPRALWAANDGMRDFNRSITYVDNCTGNHRFSAYHASMMHREARLFLESCDADVIVTHHSPSMLSQDREYRGSQLDYSYHCTDMDHVIEKTKLWLHGHTHQRLDYQHPLGCRIVCHARGYQGYELIAKAVYTGKLIEI